MKYFLGLTACCLILAGCSESRPQSFRDFEEAKIDITENKVTHFFGVDDNFQLTVSDREKLEKLLKDSKGEGIENVGFMIISNSPVLAAQKKALSDQVKSKMIGAGFLESRIVDSGVCIYKDAKKGVRVDILKYDLQRTDISLWNDFIGDCDIERSLPHYGRAMNYNIEEIVSNSADLISPRKYKGQKTENAIEAIKAAGSSNKGNSSSSKSSSSSK
ncbi:MAG: hypothetical protein J6P84_01190 [Alphaproteobacteria bacterium]|nr:hypothetical protein [Alphaproteobacteria bacterium]MBO7537023.1 hypothetical protein [Alphaproteobacteria bacterium]